MKKSVFFFLFLLPTSLFACDICNLYIGLSPDDFRNSFGILYRSRYLTGTFPLENDPQYRHSGLIEEEDVTKGKEIFNVAELRYRHYHGKKKRWQTLVALPLVNNYRSVNGFTQYDVYGLGDPMFVSSYQLFGTKKESPYVHRLIAGAGIKLPIGSRKLEYLGKTADIDMQGSTGSVDALIRTEYMAIANGMGILNQMSYRVNGKGSFDYSYGNTFNLSLLFFYRHKLSPKRIVAPAMGFLLETARSDKQSGVEIPDSGGKVWLWNVGIDLFSGRSQLQFSYQPALMNDFAGKQLPVKNRFILGWMLSM